ncbi:hypothetical protein FOZ62_026237 [Perkinsus olseni]|uniref:Uncharacterized protein n=1 Tax=Perkinsus olseni TaxID=32597 RepID=A0A7J6PS34_PEROL|nr:hypothetical protein FOZ62_026237 [Perkinsus olseni]
MKSMMLDQRSWPTDKLAAGLFLICLLVAFDKPYGLALGALKVVTVEQLVKFPWAFRSKSDDFFNRDSEKYLTKSMSDSERPLPSNAAAEYCLQYVRGVRSKSSRVDEETDSMFLGPRQPPKVYSVQEIDIEVKALKIENQIIQSMISRLEIERARALGSSCSGKSSRSRRQTSARP